MTGAEICIAIHVAFIDYPIIVSLRITHAVHMLSLSEVCHQLSNAQVTKFNNGEIPNGHG